MNAIPPPPPSADSMPDPAPKRKYVRYCRDCPPTTIKYCQMRFDKYWCDKSANGTGCNYPLTWIEQSPRTAEPTQPQPPPPPPPPPAP